MNENESGLIMSSLKCAARCGVGLGDGEMSSLFKDVFLVAV